MSGKIGQKVDKSKSKRYKAYYQNLYSNYTEEQCEKLAENFRRQSNYMCIEYWQVKYPEKTLEECEQLRKLHLLESKKSNPNHIEYYIWKHDKIKNKVAKKFGYKMIYIWESDYNLNPEIEINKCLDFLNDN